MKKLLILLLVLSSCVVNRYTCDHKCAVTPIVTFTPGAVTNLPFLETTKPVLQTTKVNKWYTLKDSTLTKHIFFGYSDMDTIGGRYFTLTKTPSVTEILEKYGMITPGRICDPPAGIIFTPGSVAPKIYWEHDTWNTFLAKSGTVVWSPLATDTTLTKNKLIIKQ